MPINIVWLKHILKRFSYMPIILIKIVINNNKKASSREKKIQCREA